MNAAAAVGDDTLQKQGQGYVVPDSFTHGTSEQRATWFRRGFEKGDINNCDTFTGISERIRGDAIRGSPRQREATGPRGRRSASRAPALHSP